MGAALAAFVAWGVPKAPAEEPNADAVCQLCGMDAGKSDTEFILQRRTKPAMPACCVNCARRLIKKAGAEVTAVTVLDYHTRKQVTAADAFYVLGSRRVPKNSMMPFVFAFGSRRDADAFKERFGGEVFTFDAILVKVEADMTGG